MVKFILTFILSSVSVAAPHPTTSASITNHVQSGIYSQLGFGLGPIQNGWIFVDSETSQKEQLSLKNKSARLQFTSEKIKNGTDLELYVKKYLRDYNQFGFEIIGLQSIKNSKGRPTSVILDIKQKNQKTQARQVFYQNEKKLVIATCTDSFDQFDFTLKDCNKILSSLYWL